MVPDAEAGEAGLYSVVRQGVEEVRDPENSPAVSMAAYLVETRQEDLFRELSVYVERGTSREEIRRMYMNAVALRIYGEGTRCDRREASATPKCRAWFRGSVQRVDGCNYIAGGWCGSIASAISFSTFGASWTSISPP